MFFMKRIFLMMAVFMLLFPNLYGNITGSPMKNDTGKNNKENSSDVILNAPRAYNGRATSPWPMRGHDLDHTGRSQYDTSKNNGYKKWKFSTLSRVFSSPAIGSDGTIYVGSEDHNLYALYSDGNEKWGFTTGDRIVFSSPAIGPDGTIYIGSYDGRLYAINPNGTKKWDFLTGKYIESSPAIGSDGTIYVGSTDNELYAINPNGTKKWDFAPGGGVGSSPAIGSDGTIYVGSYNGNLNAVNPNGTKKWVYTTGDWISSSPAIGSDGTIYIGSNDHKLHAVYPNGAKKWAFATGNNIESSPAIGSDGTIYVGSDDHKIYALFPNGTKKWEFGTGSYVISSPAIGSDGTIYIGSDDDKLYALFPNGTKKWDFTTINYVVSSPAIGSDGTIYVGSQDYTLYAIGTSNPTAPRDLKAIGGNKHVDLTWIAPRSNGGSAITNYTIYKGTTSGYETFLVKIGNALTYQDNSVTNGKKYFYEVTANNTLGEGPRSNEANATPLYRGSANSSWPMFHHDLNRTGRSQYDTSKNNGKEKWDFATGKEVRSSPAIGPDGTIYFGSNDYKLYALFPNGTQKWSFATLGSIISTPAIGWDGTIYFGSQDGKLHALYPNGTQRWEFLTGNSVFSSPVLDPDGIIYFGSYDHYLYAIDPTGTMKWGFPTGERIQSSPAIGPDGTIYFGSYDHYVYALFPNGTMKWKFDTGGYIDSSPGLGPDGTIYIGSFNGKIYALSPNGAMKWKFTTSNVVTSSPAIGSDGTVYVGSTNGYLYALNPNGSEKWNFTRGNYIGSSPAIGSDGTIYFGSGDHDLYALLPNGTMKWKFNTGTDVDSSPAIGSDGTVYFGSQDYKLYAIGTYPPTAPRDLKAKGGNGQVALDWTAPSSQGGSAIVNYTIYRGTVSGSETILRKIGNVTSYLDNSVTNGQKYYYEVTANNTFGEGPYSNEANATPVTVPTAPLDLKAAPGNAQIILNWKVPADDGGASITNYTIYRNGTLLKRIGNVLGFTDTGLVNGVNYSYNVSALNSVGEGPRSIGAHAIPRGVPSAPQGLTATPGKAQIVLTWIAPASNGGMPITGYNIYRGTTSAGETLFVQGYTGGLAWTDSNVTAGTNYFYMVSAFNNVGEGPRSNEQNATRIKIGDPPGAPTGLTASGGDRSVLLRWSAPSSGGTPARYNIYRAASQTGTYTLIASTSTMEYKDTGLTNGQKYWYKVNAQNSYGVSGNTTAVSATPFATKTTTSPFCIGFILVTIIALTVVVIAVELFRKKKT
jgi:outer membrane protein assembly factor BamB